MKENVEKSDIKEELLDDGEKQMADLKHRYQLRVRQSSEESEKKKGETEKEGFEAERRLPSSQMAAARPSL